MNELANSLKPGVIHKINHSSSFGAMDNVAEFRQACKLVGRKLVAQLSSLFLFTYQNPNTQIQAQAKEKLLLHLPDEERERGLEAVQRAVCLMYNRRE